MVGGDFYDVWEVRDSWMVVIGDVTGKGIEAAALTALVRHTLRTASEFHTSPAQLLSFVDATLKKRPALSVCTALCLRLELERDSAKFAVGGHPLPLHVTARGIQEPGEHGPLLGAFPDAQWQDFTLQLQAGDTVVAYTDGITDAQGEGDGRFGLRRLCDTLEQLGGRQVAELVYGLARRARGVPDRHAHRRHRCHRPPSTSRWRQIRAPAGDRRNPTNRHYHHTGIGERW